MNIPEHLYISTNIDKQWSKKKDKCVQIDVLQMSLHQLGQADIHTQHTTWID